MANPAIGTAIGPYTVEAIIGSGSMGDVYRAVDPALGRRVAIKILAEKHRDSPELRARFVREGRAVAAILHANVVSVFTTGTYDERPFIAMEFLDGNDLGSTVEKGGPLNSLAAASAIRDAALGLAAAAKAGLIHRDVKPSNIVRLGDGRVKVTDFGLAKPVDPGSEPALTALGVVVGTPDYIAPEQARGETIDDRVDVYALGGTLYYLLTGVPPFRTGTPAEDKYLKVVARHLRQPPPDARQRNAGAHPALAELARKMMSKRPHERPSYDAILTQLDALIIELGGAPPRPASIPGNVKSPLAGASLPGPSLPGASLPGASLPSARVSAQERDDTPAAGSSVGDSADSDISAALAAARRRPASWAIVLAVVSALFLVAALGYRLLRSNEVAPAQPKAPVDAAAAASVPPEAAQAAPPLPKAPAGMVLVVDKQRRPQFFVDQVPVSHGQYGKFFAKHKVPRGKADQPVTGVPYNFARAYAQSVGKRLLRAREWGPMIATPDVQRIGGLWEWVDDGKAGTMRGGSGDDNVGDRDRALQATTFRFAKDL